MNWTEILANAGIPESPGRDEAIAAAKLVTAERHAKYGQKRAKGSNARKVKKVARVDYKAMQK